MNPTCRTIESDKQEYVAKGKSQEAQEDTRFVSKVQHHKGTYVSIEESTKERLSFNPKPPELPSRSIRFSTMNSHEEEGNTNLSVLNHKLGRF
jgi:hypothetical protein